MGAPRDLPPPHSTADPGLAQASREYAAIPWPDGAASACPWNRIRTADDFRTQGPQVARILTHLAAERDEGLIGGAPGEDFPAMAALIAATFPLPPALIRRYRRRAFWMGRWARGNTVPDTALDPDWLPAATDIWSPEESPAQWFALALPDADTLAADPLVGAPIVQLVSAKPLVLHPGPTADLSLTQTRLLLYLLRRRYQHCHLNRPLADTLRAALAHIRQCVLAAGTPTG